MIDGSNQNYFYFFLLALKPIHTHSIELIDQKNSTV